MSRNEKQNTKLEAGSAVAGSGNSNYRSATGGIAPPVRTTTMTTMEIQPSAADLRSYRYSQLGSEAESSWNGDESFFIPDSNTDATTDSTIDATTDSIIDATTHSHTFFATNQNINAAKRSRIVYPDSAITAHGQGLHETLSAPSENYHVNAYITSYQPPEEDLAPNEPAHYLQAEPGPGPGPDDKPSSSASAVTTSPNASGSAVAGGSAGHDEDAHAKADGNDGVVFGDFLVEDGYAEDGWKD